MVETLNWDHTMVDVTDLQDAIDYFNAKGLAFAPGGKHEYWGTKNALDYFGLNYIELLTVADKEKAAAFPYQNNSAIHDAVEDYFDGIQRITTIAIRTDDIVATHRRLKGLGLDVGEITDGKRVDPAGKLVQWKIFYINDELANHLPAPFFIQWNENDDQRREDLKKQGLIKFHPAGDLFVKQAVFNVSDPEETAKQWSAILQAEVLREGDNFTVNIGNKQLIFTPGVENRLFKLIFHGAKLPEKLQLGQIRFELTDKE
ncbi:VOC family protein [Limosilactobacillus walteri]|uniref:VOC family protein n=1 Tax=Limosilactobacillus walteri TaxID=2268022 RepID=A0ABR8P5X8_9LACO|nr:VOC family protein [Limosilactobacillus walteri]MBD5806130.1 VOC family protein [Limosilactobacillus walteri]